MPMRRGSRGYGLGSQDLSEGVDVEEKEEEGGGRKWIMASGW